MTTNIVETPPAPVVPPFPALGSANFNEEAYAAGSALPGLSAGIHAIGIAAAINARAAKELALSAHESVLEATEQSDAAMGYRNTAQAAAGNSTAEANRSRGEAEASMGHREAAETAAGDATTEANRSREEADRARDEADRGRYEADRAEDAAASISSGPVTSVNGKPGVVVLTATDIAPAATTAEMQAGEVTAPRSMSPANVADAISALSKLQRVARTSNVQLMATDSGKWFDIASGTFTQTFLAPAALGAGWWCYLRNSGTGDITIPASDERTNWIMYPGEMRLFQCDGATLRTVVLSSFCKTVTTSGVFIKPPGYALFFYLAKTSFGARIVKPSYGISATGAPRLNLLRIEEDLSEAHLRLSRVFIECKPYDQVIKRFDKPGTLFYLDPPYWACEKDYGEGVFSREDFGRLAGLLDGLKGKFILSLNDKPEVRETFANFKVESVKTRYSISGSSKQEASEVLISNFPLQ